MSSDFNSPPLHALRKDLRSAIGDFAMTPAAEVLLAGNLDGYIAWSAGPCFFVKTPDAAVIPTTAFIMNLAPTGYAKSPMTRLFDTHFASLEEAHKVSVVDAWEEYEASLDLWKACVEGVRRQVRKQVATKGIAQDDLRDLRIELEKSKPKRPPDCPRRVEDVSYAAWVAQALRHLMTLFLVDEPGGFLSDLDKRLISAMCTGWSGMSHQHGRADRGVSTLNALPVVVLNEHPEHFLKFLKTPKGKNCVDVGWDGRFLHYVVLESEFAKRRSRQDDPDPLALQPVLDRAAYLFEMQVRMNQNGWADRTVLELSRGALDEYRDVEYHFQKLRLSAASPAEMAVIDKAAENVLRHAGRHHAFHDVSGAITAKEIADSADWVGWCVEGYFSLLEHGQSSSRNVEQDAERLRELMLHRLRGRGDMSRRNLGEAAFNIGFARPSEFNNALSWLCDRGFSEVRDGIVYWDTPDHYRGRLHPGGVHRM
ncbi:PF13148 family protein [Bordetella bronchiseptica 99-R-0433]|uniref:DUF3987 domain-containing protein n=1 Tax=Bordetella bronchiseptica TaxID=518 RepID=UPI000459520E|nr:DUF3987 domain-containing protein [Bordetella bronchiseptica]KCV64663.1 PF13148 family protein [Bordetella bronchiseptica 99-R-0433]